MFDEVNFEVVIRFQINQNFYQTNISLILCQKNKSPYVQQSTVSSLLMIRNPTIFQISNYQAKVNMKGNKLSQNSTSQCQLMRKNSPASQHSLDSSSIEQKWSELLKTQNKFFDISRQVSSYKKNVQNFKKQQDLLTLNLSTHQEKLKNKKKPQIHKDQKHRNDQQKKIQKLNTQSEQQHWQKLQKQCQELKLKIQNINDQIKQAQTQVDRLETQWKNYENNVQKIQNNFHPNSQINKLLKTILCKSSNPYLSQFKTETIQIAQDKTLKNHQKAKKLREIQFNLSQRKQQIEEQRTEPYFLLKPFKKSVEDYARVINFFMMSSFIVGFFLASKQKSKAIDQELPFMEMTFRNYLSKNAWLTLCVTTIFYLFNITLTKLLASKQSNNQASITVLKYLRLAYEVIMTLSVVLILIVKVVWISVGIYLFLRYLNFAKCSDKLVGYCLIQFTVYFVYTWYLIMKVLFKTNAKNAIEKYDSDDKNSDTQSKINSQKKKSELKQVFSKNLLLYVNLDDFQYLLKKAMTWQLAGFILELILLVKDHSSGIDTTIFFEDFTFRNWMLSDVVVNGLLYFYFLVHWSNLTRRGYDFPVWRHEEKGLFYIEFKSISEGTIQLLVLVALFIAKISSLAIGLYSLYNDINFEKCTSVLIVFLITYFTQKVFLIVEGSSLFINGKRSKSKLLSQVMNEEQSGQMKEQSEEKMKSEEEKKRN